LIIVDERDVKDDRVSLNERVSDDERASTRDDSEYKSIVMQTDRRIDV